MSDPFSDCAVRVYKATNDYELIAVDHPPHYLAHPSGVECIQITEHMNFNLGNAVKYIWRCDEKFNEITDLRKAAWYINREIERRVRAKQIRTEGEASAKTPEPHR